MHIISNNMMQEKRESFVRKIAKIAENLHEPSVRGSRRTRFVAGEDAAFSLANGALDLWDNIIKDLLIINRWNAKFSEKYLDKKLQEIMNKIIKDGDSRKALEYFNQLVDDYEQYSKIHILYLPLFGIEMVEKPIKLGNVVLKRMDDNSIEELESRIEKTVNQSLNTDEEKQMFVEQENENLNKFLRNKVCAIIEVTAEPDRALEIAETEAERTIDLLRYAIPAIYSPSKNVAVGLQGEYSYQTRYTPIFAIDGKSFSCINSVVGPLFPLELSDTNVRHMRNIGVFTLGEIMEKKQPSKFEEELLKGIEWFSRAQTQSEPKNKLLNLITVLETFLTPGQNDPIQKSIAEGVAILLGKDAVGRKKIMKRIKEFYGARSKLSHGHSKEILDTDVRELSNIAGLLIMRLTELRNQFVSKNELIEWIEYVKLGGTPEQWDEYKKILNN